MQVSKEWLEKYSKIKNMLKAQDNLEEAFTKKEINDAKLEILDLGEVNIESGKIVVCDPLAYLDEESLSFIQEIKPNKYKVFAGVLEDEERYAIVKLQISDKAPKYYDLALTGVEELEHVEDGDFFGFPVDAGMACICDYNALTDFIKFEDKLIESKGDDYNRYDDLFAGLLEDNAKKYPKYQSEYGDWLNFNIPESKYNIVLFQSGYGDGFYPSYFGYDDNDEICALYIVFIDLFADD